MMEDGGVEHVCLRGALALVGEECNGKINVMREIW